MSLTLLAKSAPPSDKDAPPTILEHCRDVRDAADALWEVIERHLADAMRFDRGELPQLRILLRAAALLHDFGKANSAFQTMIRTRGKATERQPVRHEILGAWLLTDPDFLGNWFLALRGETDCWPIVWAVAGHHLKM